MESSRNAWLMKAEPESRIVKGKDVAFSIDDLEKVGIEHWDGVRNHEAKNLMKEKMRKGDRVLFYHSNCKFPGIAGIAEIDKEGYPDFTAFDPSHPYHDPKSMESKPTWFMVDVKFVSRLPNFVPLKLLQNLISGKVSLPDYLTTEDLQAIKDMPLLNRGRLSVQPVPLEAFEVVRNLGVKGGWLSTEKVNSASKPTKISSDQSDGTNLDNPQSNKRKTQSGTTQPRRIKRSKN
ncbi:hypothetical protein PTTG_09287 [Puccinia triticina 1-1 BBBD Race 1]|uniref:EVE domain-containing protein n=1 Tax=Puccinia triticina (isolate 1-1 / race 1 (BBBD)) TaxID=630390 RepID=A0A180GBX1_PUCT1|nr:hypothetical protein PTTG_09287 [Puccinia triticina 1-1 BBBD Race 1]WAR54789.1 hypothetical protein PtB15_4B407 [Puccinia triticina]